ncbi:MAG: hypothetical protein RLZZ577_1301, partial [Bacteroidota bacterium]
GNYGIISAELVQLIFSNHKLARSVVKVVNFLIVHVAKD